LEKAFDRVDRNVMADIMRSYGYDETLINVALDLHTGTSARVKWRRELSDPSPLRGGVNKAALRLTLSGIYLLMLLLDKH
jgi:hypothetical protein